MNHPGGGGRDTNCNHLNTVALKKMQSKIENWWKNLKNSFELYWHSTIAAWSHPSSGGSPRLSVIYVGKGTRAEDGLEGKIPAKLCACPVPSTHIGQHKILIASAPGHLAPLGSEGIYTLLKINKNLKKK